MILSCLSKCQPGDMVTICYTGSTSTHMAQSLTPYQREFTVIKLSEYYPEDYMPTIMVPMIGSNRRVDGMRLARNSYYSKTPLFDYEWVVHPSYNYIVKIRKKQK